jgi:ribulose-5-phosphate 4-epimerase/fuculose-1-phosphate aldolase
MGDDSLCFPDASAEDRSGVAMLVLANRILAMQGVVDGFGHVSVRRKDDPARFFLARSMAPALVTAADIREFDLSGAMLGNATGQPYLERFIHSSVYQSKPSTQAIVHSHSLAVLPFTVVSTPLRPIYHMSAFIKSPPPLFDIYSVCGPSDMLIRSPSLGNALADTMKDADIVLMRGHGSVVAGGTLPQAVFRAIYLEINAKLQMQAMSLGDVTFLRPEEALLASVSNDSQIDRCWNLWVRALQTNSADPA